MDPVAVNLAGDEAAELVEVEEADLVDVRLTAPLTLLPAKRVERNAALDSIVTD